MPRGGGWRGTRCMLKAAGLAGQVPSAIQNSGQAGDWWYEGHNNITRKPLVHLYHAALLTLLSGTCFPALSAAWYVGGACKKRLSCAGLLFCADITTSALQKHSDILFTYGGGRRNLESAVVRGLEI